MRWGIQVTTTGLSRNRTFPGRRLFGEEELQAVQAVFESAWESGRDFGYDGPFEVAYCSAFSKFQGGGYTDGVSSGTAAVFLALLSLDLPRGSDVIVSPVTDPGSINPVTMAGMTPIVADSAPRQFNVDVTSFEAALTPNTRAAILTHSGGIPIDIEPIIELAAQRNIEIIEDASQAHGARIAGRRVGTFGRVAAFSTMFSKHHASGGCGGLVYTRDESIFRRIKALADRGKDPSAAGFHPKDPNTFLFPALNFNMDEISASIGHSTLRKLDATLERRRELAAMLPTGLFVPKDAEVAPFFHTVWCDPNIDLTGLPVNSDYRYLPSEWSWLSPTATTPNAVATRNGTVNILFHERYTDADMQWIADRLRDDPQPIPRSNAPL